MRLFWLGCAALAIAVGGAGWALGAPPWLAAPWALMALPLGRLAWRARPPRRGACWASGPLIGELGGQPIPRWIESGGERWVYWGPRALFELGPGQARLGEGAPEPIFAGVAMVWGELLFIPEARAAELEAKRAAGGA